jgi:hypothetical protein
MMPEDKPFKMCEDQSALHTCWDADTGAGTGSDDKGAGVDLENAGGDDDGPGITTMTTGRGGA